MPKDYYLASGKKPGGTVSRSPRQRAADRGIDGKRNLGRQVSNHQGLVVCLTRHCGENWFLAGESAGFADPILAAGLTISQFSAKECALTLLELLRTEKRKDWLLNEYSTRQEVRIRGHIRFADYWYSANTQFGELQGFVAKIAADSGLDLSPQKAWQWLAQGGFIDDDANLGPAGFGIEQIKRLGEFLADVPTDSLLRTCNRFELNLEGAHIKKRAEYAHGAVSETESYVRGDRVLPMVGIYRFMVQLLQEGQTTQEIANVLKRMVAAREGDRSFANDYVGRVPHALEAMVSDGWVIASNDPAATVRDLPERVARVIKWNEDNIQL